MNTKICLVLTGKTLEENKVIINENRKYIDLAELRVDYLNSEEICKIHSFPSSAGIPLILTVRRKNDGGLFNDCECHRIQIFENAFCTGSGTKFEYVDFEEDFDIPHLEKLAYDFNIKIIRSFHNIKAPIKNIALKINTLKQKKHSLIKIAFYAPSLTSTSTAFRETRTLNENGLIISVMGGFGLPSRILAPILGSKIVYTFTDEYIKSENLSGTLISARSLHTIYNISALTEKTKILGVTGGLSVNGSLSPSIHNKLIKNANLDKIYIPVPAKNIEELLEFAKVLGIEGLSITTPFKTAIIPNLKSINDIAENLGAVNTVVRQNGVMHGFNTDFYGFKKALLEFLNETSLKGKKIAIIGAGGAARAAAAAVFSLGGDVCIFNRTLAKAAGIAKQYGFKYAGLCKENIPILKEYSGLIIQASSAGMQPNEFIDPLDFYSFEGIEKVFDLIYKPEKTLLLKRAKKAGCKICNGLKMLEYQAEKQFEIFNN